MVDLMFEPLLQPIAIPLVAGLVCLLMPNAWATARGWLAVLAALMTLVATLPLFTDEPRSAEIGLLLLRVDRLSGFILVATAAFGTLIAVYSVGFMKGKAGRRTYDVCLLWSVSLSCGVLLANELVVLVICWGLLAVTLYLMIGLSGPDASAAAVKTLLIVGGADALLTLGIGLFWVGRARFAWMRVP